MLAIYRRELMAYFNSTLAWVLMAIYLFILGLVFNAMVDSYAQYSMRAQMSPFGGSSVNVMDDLVVPVVWWMGFLMLFILPLLTMRLLAEERRAGTLELLFSYPLSDLDIILGKFFAALSVMATMLAFTMASLIMLQRLTPLEWPLIGAGYGGLLLLGGAFIAFGLWASSLTDSQMIAAVVSYGGLMMMWLLSALDDHLSRLTELFGDLSVMSHLEAMARGSVNTHDIVYYLAWIVLFLFLTARVLESRKWSN